jgi:deoxyribodipyrimidine photolyase-related protein
LPTKKLIVILGNQLFAPALLAQKIEKAADCIIYMREDEELCTHFRYHQQKIVFFLSAMRQHAEKLREAGFEVHYEKIGEKKGPYEEALSAFVKKCRAESLHWFEIEDKFFALRMESLAEKLKLQLEIWLSPMFLTTRDQFRDYLREIKMPMMRTFYERQRKRLRIMVTEDLKPVGGQWSFDEENRQPLPKNYEAPALPTFKANKIQREVITLTEETFSDHPGKASFFWLPTDREGAQAWLDDFLEKRFANFGAYEDAMSTEFPFVSHSVLTPYLNSGLLTPAEVVKSALKIAASKKIPLNSTEGFLRQVIGWREFIRGIYQQFSEQQDEANFWKHQRELSSHWYKGDTGIAPLDDVIKKTLRYGYAHHIERLMVVGSLMLLLEIKPKAAHRWFMEMYIDSSDWVMGPNVYGMALFSDGGIFATKPYICGSNYYKKMGGYTKGDWQDGVDGLYWSFIERHKKFFLQNPRLSMMARTLEKIGPEKKTRIYQAADQLRDRLTLNGK